MCHFLFETKSQALRRHDAKSSVSQLDRAAATKDRSYAVRTDSAGCGRGATEDKDNLAVGLGDALLNKKSPAQRWIGWYRACVTVLFEKLETRHCSVYIATHRFWKR
jgi:hypothetical protein